MNHREFRRGLQAVQRSVEDLLAAVDEMAEVDPAPAHPVEAAITWRERLWTCDPQTRLCVEELAEALGRSASWVYKRTASTCDSRLPFRKLDGAVVFVVGEIRVWIRDCEEIVEPGRLNRLQVIAGGDR